MSDILIRGMEMPGSCAACDFYNVISGCCTRTGTKINFSELTTRSVDCPISELQPHGDLKELLEKAHKEFIEEARKTALSNTSRK